MHNTRTGQREAYESYTEEGVTPEDLLKSKTTRIDGSLFTGNLTKSEAKTRLNVLKREFEIKSEPEMRPEMRQIVRGSGKTATHIVDDSLRNFVTYLVVIMGDVDSRAQDIFKLDIYARLYEKEIGGREKRKRKSGKNIYANMKRCINGISRYLENVAVEKDSISFPNIHKMTLMTF